MVRTAVLAAAAVAAFAAAPTATAQQIFDVVRELRLCFTSCVDPTNEGAYVRSGPQPGIGRIYSHIPT